MDDAFDSAFENSSEDSDTRRSIRIKQEFAFKAKGILRRFLAKL